jgi:hypothetical protein
MTDLLLSFCEVRIHAVASPPPFRLMGRGGPTYFQVKMILYCCGLFKDIRNGLFCEGKITVFRLNDEMQTILTLRLPNLFLNFSTPCM